MAAVCDELLLQDGGRERRPSASELRREASLSHVDDGLLAGGAGRSAHERLDVRGILERHRTESG